VHCPTCQSIVPTDANYCPMCGIRVTHAVMGPTQRLSSPHNGLGLPYGICPYCQTATVYTDQDRRATDQGTTALVITRGFLPQDAPTVHYVCTTCGYLERYVPYAYDRRMIAQHWSYVTPNRPSSL
jgi:RNA polymerase subunit RPABC4/transcription elongation factor Spt4